MWLIIFLCQAAPPAPEDVEPEPVEKAPRKLFVIYDDSRESRMLLAELQRDWSKFGLDELNRIAIFLRSEVVLVDCKSVAELRLISSGYPYWRLGTRGELNRFDERTFHDTGRPLATLHALHWNQTCDLSTWKRECEQVQHQEEMKHWHQVIEWLRVSAPDRAGNCRNCLEWGLAENIRFIEMQREYANYVGFPVYVAPKLPASPFRLFPWERSR